MPQIYVKPSPGGRIRMPERNYQPMDPKGAWVSRVDYYERLIIGGDVIICDPPAEDEPAAEATHVHSYLAAEAAPAAELSLAINPETPAA